MKLVVFVPCLNEEKSLPLVLKTIPSKIEGVDCIEVLIVDDGSTDKTVEVAKGLGVKHFLRHAKTQGLSRSFQDGIRRSLELGADVIVLTDGDNQYPQERIPDLIRPILAGEADVVIADRQVQTIAHFSPAKKMLQKLGTWVVNRAAGAEVPDAVSGFRAYSKAAALGLNLVTRYSFAAESIIQAAHRRQAIATIKITTNPKLRESRQFKSTWRHVLKSSVTIARSFAAHRPLAVFLSLGFTFLAAGLAPFAAGAQRPRALLIGAALLSASFISFALGVVADSVRINRLLLEDILEELRRDRLDGKP